MAFEQEERRSIQKGGPSSWQLHRAMAYMSENVADDIALSDLTLLEQSAFTPDEIAICVGLGQ